jgi:trk system potassium uptake protein TrkA
VHVVVVGCGRVGSELAGLIDAVGHTVSVVDKRKEAFRRLPSGFRGYRINGFGFDRETLTEAGVEDADAFAAVTSGDNSNILSARVARETFGIERVVARIYDPRRAAIYQRLGIPTVATVAWTTDQVMRRLLPEGSDAAHDWIDPTAKVCLVERVLPSSWAGYKLGELVAPGRFWLAALTRFGEAQIVGEKPVGQEGDVAYFIARVDCLEELSARLEAGPEH